MRIVLVNKFFHHQGGAERSYFDVFNLLESHGHQIIPFSMADSGNEKSEYAKYFVSNVNFGGVNKSLSEKMRLFGRMVYSQEAKKKFESLVRTTKPDLVHIHNIYHQISPSILDVCCAHNLPVVQTVHDYSLICPNYLLYCNGVIHEKCKGGNYYHEVFDKCFQNSYSASAAVALEMYIHKWMGIYKKNVDTWICPSQFVKRKLVEFGMPKERMVVMYHFMAAQAKPISTKKGDYLLCAGRLSSEKGFDIAIQAMKHLKNERLIILGQGPQETELKTIVKALGLSKQVDFLGYKTQGEVYKYMASAKAMLVPSRVYETFGYTIADSLAMGVPVVGARIGAIPELLEHVSSQLLFEPNNERDLAKHIEWVLENPKDMAAIVKKGKDWVESNLSSDGYYLRLIELYKKIIRLHRA